MASKTAATVVGAKWIARAAAQIEGDTPNRMGIGSDGTAADETDTDLGAEIARVTADSLAVVDGVMQLDATFGFAGSGTAREAGWFTKDGGAAVLLERFTFDDIAYTPSTTIEIGLELEVSAPDV